ncbi:MAG: hypothetical protein WA194_07520 [Patescibacteria group bacterium]
MSTTLDPKLRESSESVPATTVAEPNPALNLADSVAKKVADAVPETAAIVESAESAEEGQRLLALFEALKKVSYNAITEDEYRLLLEYGCVYEQGERLKKRVADELSWFETKKAILDDAAGFWGFMKRMKLEGRPIADWFGVEYEKEFPDGTLAYQGYDHAQTTTVVNKRIAMLGNPEFGNPEWPLETVRAREWWKRLKDLVYDIRKRRGTEGGSSDYSDLSDVGGIWLPASVIAAFAISGMSIPANEGGFSF